MPAPAWQARVGPRAARRSEGRSAGTSCPKGAAFWFRLPPSAGPAWCPDMTTHAVTAPIPGYDRAWGSDEVTHRLRICVRRLTDLRRWEEPDYRGRCERALAMTHDGDWDDQ